MYPLHSGSVYRAAPEFGRRPKVLNCEGGFGSTRSLRRVYSQANPAWRLSAIRDFTEKRCGRMLPYCENKISNQKNMKIVIIGGSGLIGTKLVNNLRKQGHEVVPASRSSGIDAFTGNKSEIWRMKGLKRRNRWSDMIRVQLGTALRGARHRAAHAQFFTLTLDPQGFSRTQCRSCRRSEASCRALGCRCRAHAGQHLYARQDRTGSSHYAKTVSQLKPYTHCPR